MEYVEGRTLRALLEDLGTVPEALVREIGRQVAEGLAAIHEAGVVHRDVKPENVLITDDHRVRIMDLGVARIQDASVALTQEGQFAGSLLYAAPEQLRRGTVGPAADLYALGVVLHELATGRNPFRAEDAAGVMRAHLEERPPTLTEVDPDLSPFLAEVVSTLLEKDPAKRFPSAADLGEGAGGGGEVGVVGGARGGTAPGAGGAAAGAGAPGDEAPRAGGGPRAPAGPLGEGEGGERLDPPGGGGGGDREEPAGGRVPGGPRDRRRARALRLVPPDRRDGRDLGRDPREVRAPRTSPTRCGRTSARRPTLVAPFAALLEARGAAGGLAEPPGGRRSTR